MAAQMPIASWRRAGGKMASTRAKPEGNSMAPPTDCSALAPISQGNDWAAPDSSEPTANTVIPTKNSRLRPKRSEAQPATSSNEATPME